MLKQNETYGRVNLVKVPVRLERIYHWESPDKIHTYGIKVINREFYVHASYSEKSSQRLKLVGRLISRYESKWSRLTTELCEQLGGKCNCKEKYGFRFDCVADSEDGDIREVAIINCSKAEVSKLIGELEQILGDD